MLYAVKFLQNRRWKYDEKIKGKLKVLSMLIGLSQAVTFDIDVLAV